MSANTNLVGCPYCPKRSLKGSKGLNGHISRTRRCREARYRHLLSQSVKQQQACHCDDTTTMQTGTHLGQSSSMSSGHGQENVDTPDIDIDECHSDDQTMNDTTGAHSGSTSLGLGDAREPSLGVDEWDSDYPSSHRFQRRSHPHVAFKYGPRRKTQWEELCEAMDKCAPFHPWASRNEFELVEWLSTSKLSQQAIDRFLQLNAVTVSHPSYTTHQV